jgi:hypothetical protein
MTTTEDKKNKKDIVIAIAFIVFAVFFFFFMDYFQKQRLLKNGIRSNAEVIGRYYEVNTDTKDTSGYSMRLKVIADSGIAGSINSGEILTAFIKKKSFDKYKEGAILKVVYYKDDVDHTRILEEIE